MTSDLALIDKTLFVLMDKLDGVFYRDDMVFPCFVDVVDHGGERGRLTTTSRTSYEYESARATTQFFQYGRHTELIECLYSRRDYPEHSPLASPVVIDVCAETHLVAKLEREIKLQVSLEFALLIIREDIVEHSVEGIAIERR
jgi:hypothetical protein